MEDYLFEVIDTVSLEFTSSLQVEFKTANESINLLTIEADKATEKMEPAETYLNNYAKAVGFTLHRKRVVTDSNREVRQHTFKCSYSGESVSNQVIDLSRQRDLGEHNHQLQPDATLFAPKYRKLSSEILETIEFYVTKGNMGSKQILPLLTTHFSNHIIHKSDLYNTVQRFRRPINQYHGEVQKFVECLLQLKNQNLGWIVHIRIDLYDNRLLGVFWMSPLQQQYLIHYIDIIQTDNICQTNWFNMYLTLLVVVDNNIRTWLVAQSLSDDETTESYEWFFECLKNAIHNISPAVLFSDTKPALISAVALKLPEMHHFLCAFHIQENICKNLRSKLGRNFDEFYKEFLHMHNSTFEEDFFRKWSHLLNKYPQAQDYFNRALQGCIKLWTHCYQLKVFIAGIQSTQHVEVNLQLDYKNGFLEEQLDRPQVSIAALMKDIDISDIVEIWELIVSIHWYQDNLQDKKLNVLQQQSIEISTTFQQNTSSVIVSDLHIIKQIRDNDMFSAKSQQIVNKKVQYANEFGKMKKALNTALNLGYEKELINLITSFIDQKVSIYENFVIDPLVVKRHGWLPSKRLKSSSEDKSHKGLECNYSAINIQDPNLRTPLSNINSNIVDTISNIEENKRKYICNICGGTGHNAHT
ncbi:1863_t:CDS:2, partial [Scutellospora calospora]